MGNRLQGATIAITGAGSGMGAAFAIAMAREGANIGVLDYDGDGAERVAEAIRAEGGHALSARTDVRDRAGVQDALHGLVERFGRLDVMFNNAGVGLKLPFLDTTEDDIRRLHDVNVVGVLIGMQEAAKIFIAQGGGGKIVNTCSVASRQANADFSAYAASKFAVRSLVQSGARSLAQHGIVVTGFSPGIVDTPLWRSNFPDDAARDAALEAYAQRIPAGRVSTPDDIVPVAVFLASHDSDYTTGQVVAVDGGLEMV